ncbi:MAG TPA: hypothetical protein DCZ91_12640 [Lachnospiraceae bacterium]|nr:hypothetical protein [Lachnospiraceae bacterium]
MEIDFLITEGKRIRMVSFIFRCIWRCCCKDRKLFVSHCTSIHLLYIILLKSLDKELPVNNLHKFMVKFIDFTSIFENPPLTEL